MYGEKCKFAHYTAEERIRIKELQRQEQEQRPDGILTSNRAVPRQVKGASPISSWLTELPAMRSSRHGSG